MPVLRDVSQVVGQASGPASLDCESSARVGRELVRYGRRLEADRAAQDGSGFSGRDDVDAWIESDPNAFLFGALFTQGIPAERAWAGPFELKMRLGHFDVGRLAASSVDEIERALARPPALHRFKRTLPRYIVGTASVLVRDYGGDAARIWGDEPSARELTARLEALPGIGTKKAAMAVELLIRRFGVTIRDPGSARLPDDVHVRRVMLRTGLVDSDDLDSLQRAAARISPERPSLIDLPLWLVGRRWCRPTRPLCEECLLGVSCAKLTDRLVDGAGVRRAARTSAGDRASLTSREG